MRKLTILVILSMLSSLAAAVYPVDSEIGLIVEAAPESTEGRILKAFCEPFSPEWIEEYAEEGRGREFSLFYSETLSSLLPLSSPLVSAEEDGVIRLKDTSKGVLVTVFIDDAQRITALSVR